MRKVMVFGTFDGVHPGHQHLFHEAMEQGDELIVVVTRDEHALELKGRVPENNLSERMEMVSYESEVSLVVPSDEDLGTYGVVREYEPDVVLFGYDQDELQTSFRSWLIDNEDVDIECVLASAYMPETFKTSLLQSEFIDEGVGLL